MALDDLLDDRQPEPATAAGIGGAHEAAEHARAVLRGDARAAVLDAQAGLGP